MAGIKTIVSVTLAVTIAAILLGPIVSSVTANTGVQTVTNETITADNSSYVELDGYDLVNGSETVYGYNDTSGNYETATEGTDYELNESSGSIKALSGSSLIDDGEDVKVTYDYNATGDMTATIIGYGPTFLGLLMLVTVAMKVQNSM